jgi:streptomycin 6-kinase
VTATESDIPELVRNNALSAGAGPWLDGLPALLAVLARDWGITIGPPYGDATEAFVAEATLADGTPAVLKVLIPRDAGAEANEITVLRLAGGEGCVRLLRGDAAQGALLLERLGRSMHEMGLPLDRRLELLCVAATRVWRPAPDCGLPTGAAKGLWLIDFVTTAWEDLGRPCSERAVDHAVACAERASRSTTTSGPCSCTATSTSGTRSRLRGAASSWSTPTGCWPRRSTTWASSCARTRSSCSTATAA